MKLQTRFLVCVAAVLVGIVALAGWCWHYVSETQLEASAMREMERAQSSLSATRTYTRDVLSPRLQAASGAVIPEA